MTTKAYNWVIYLDGRRQATCASKAALRDILQALTDAHPNSHIEVRKEPTP